MAKKYLSLGSLSIAPELLNFINNELLPGTGITKKRFWNGFDKCVHELTPINKKLINRWNTNRSKLLYFSCIIKTILVISFTRCNNSFFDVL